MIQSFKPRTLLLAFATTLLPLAALAGPVVQPLPGEGPPSLSSALLRLGRDPHDTAALIDAGNAALAMGDTDAATGFYTRADRLMPNNPAIQAGLAGARVRAEDPFSAIPLFQSAERNGTIPAELLADRGLAYDLVADNPSAQKYYRQALAAGAGDEATRRLAISLAIAGDRRGAEAALAPLLDKQDRSAWRTRAFMLAILGREDEAVSVVRATMPAELATGVSPYLRYMRQLTPAQQAAAANLGHFPRAAEIGHDDPRIAQYAPPRPVRVAVAEPVADPKAKRQKDRKRRRGEDAEPPTEIAAIDRSEAPPEPTRISRATEPARPIAGELPPVGTSTAVATAPSRLRSVPATLPNARPTAVAVATPAPIPVATPTPAAPAPQPVTPSASRPAAIGFDLARTPGAVAVPLSQAPAPAPSVATPAPAPVTPAPVPLPTAIAAAPTPSVAVPAPVAPAPTPAPTPAPAPAPAPKPQAKPAPASFADAFADLATHKSVIAPRAGSVDIRKITPARPAPPPPPPPPPNPSRVWVQVGVGRAESRLEYDWRHLQKDDPELFRARKAWVSEWGRTNRLLIGPFDTEKAADSFVAKLHKAGHDDAFTWLSPAGQVVDPL